MPRRRLVVIGGVAAGMSTASRARKVSPEMEIVVLEKGIDVSYGACGLPYLLGGAVKQPDDLIVYDVEFFRTKRNIDVRLECEAIQIQPGRKRVIALDRGTRRSEFPYDSLVIATGATPDISLPGSQLQGVFPVSSLASALRLRAWIEQQHPERAVIVGSGYIGLEMTEALGSRGLRVTLLERSDHLASGFGLEIESRIRSVLQTHRIEVLSSTAALGLVGDESGRVRQVVCSGGRNLPADLVILASGMQPRTTLAADAGVRLGPSGAIAVDERMQTSVASIYAAGDCAETRNLITGRPFYFPLGTTANKQGRVAGENAAGGQARFEGIVGTLITRVFELGLARTGLTLPEARQYGFRPGEVTIDATTHARYLGGKAMTLTLIWDMDSGRLLGCQMAGEEHTAKRIDAAAIALHARMRVQDMLHLDLSYAPPYATVWDPLLIAAHEATKMLRRGIARRTESSQ